MEKLFYFPSGASYFTGGINGFFEYPDITKLSVTTTPSYGLSPLTVTFTPSYTGDISDLLYYEWFYGDGTNATENTSHSHTYFSEGIYTWIVDVYFADGTILNKTGEITVSKESSTNDDDTGTTNRCFAFGFNTEQGIGFSEITGDIPFPESENGIITVYDENKRPHLLVLNYLDGKFYDIATFDGPTNTPYVEVHKDKTGVDGTGGTDIEGEVEFPEDIGTSESFYLKNRENHIFVRPSNDENRGAAGYDAYGYPTGLVFDIESFVDGELNTASARAEDISMPQHMIKFDKDVTGNRHKTVIGSNMGQHQIIERSTKYVVQDIPPAPSGIITSELTHQESLANLQHWLFGSTLNTNRVNAQAFTLAGTITPITGPAGISGIGFTIQTSIAIPAASGGTLLIWHKTGYTISGITLTEYDTSGSWILSYYTGSISGGTILGTGDVCDYRYTNAALTVDDIEYYFNDYINNSAQIVTPGI